MRIKSIRYHYPDFDKIKDNNTFFDTVKNTYPELKKSGMYLEGKKKSIFVYRIKTKFKTYHGILAGVDIEDYLKGNIRKHENTLIAQEENISRLMKERNAVIKPVLIAYQERKKIKDLIIKSFLGKRPKYVIELLADQQIHEFFQITDPKWIKEFQKEFNEKVGKAYIADGHHRMASISQLIQANPTLTEHKLNYILCALFDFNELSIMPYNRIIQLDTKLDEPEFIKALEPFADIALMEKIKAPQKKHEMMLYVNKAAYQIKWKSEIIKEFKIKNKIAFDIDLFNDIILKQIFHISDIRSNKRITNVEGNKTTKSVCKQIDEMANTVGFFFYPVKVNDFTKIADAKMVLPPKSTWFEPRIKNGIIVQEFEL